MAIDNAESAQPVMEDPEARSARLEGAAFWATFVLTTLGLLLSVNQIFNLGLGGFRPISTAYYYLIIGLFGAIGFLAFPARKFGRGRVPWYDWICAAAILGLTIWIATTRSGRSSMPAGTPPGRSMRRSSPASSSRSSSKACGAPARWSCSSSA